MRIFNFLLVFFLAMIGISGSIDARAKKNSGVTQSHGSKKLHSRKTAHATKNSHTTKSGVASGNNAANTKKAKNPKNHKAKVAGKSGNKHTTRKSTRYVSKSGVKNANKNKIAGARNKNRAPKSNGRNGGPGCQPFYSSLSPSYSSFSPSSTFGYEYND